jgi:hypothetical protein
MRWRRTLRTPLLLLGINLALGALTAGVVYGYAGAQVSRRDHLTSMMQDLSQQRADAIEDQAYIREHQTTFETLLEEGLLAPQDRLEAARLLEQLGRRYRLNDVRYSFSPQRAAPLGPGRLAQTTLLTTEVTIEMSAVLDLDLLRFARAVRAHLPGDVQVTGFGLERRGDPGPDLLARLRAGQRVDLVTGHLELEWRALRRPGGAASGAAAS